MTKTNSIARFIPGRGNSKASRKNLVRGASRRWFVYERGAGIGWVELAGPMFQAQATEWAAKLEKQNNTGTTMFAAAMGNA